MPHPGRGEARPSFRALGPPALACAVLLAGAVAAPTARAQSGSPDPTFGVSGLAVAPGGSLDDFGNAVAIQADDRIVVAGQSVVANDDFAIARFDLDGSLDATLGGTGIVTTPIGSGIDQAFAVAIQPDQKIVVAGFSRESGNEDFALARFHPDGSLDASFGGDGTVTAPIGALDDRAAAVAIQSDGKIIVAGYGLTGANRDLALARFLTDGSLDPSFSGDGKLLLGIGTGNDEAFAVALQPDGKILVAGYAADGSQHDMLVARFSTTGALDPTFNGTGAQRIAFGTGNEFAHALALQPDGKVLLAGYARIGTVFNFAVARVDDVGALDPGLDGDGRLTVAIGSTSQARAIALDQNGRFVVAGFATIAGNDDFALSRHNANGSLDTSFAGTGIVTTPIGTGPDQATGVALQRDAKVVMAGTARSGNDDDFALARYLVDDCGNGTVDAGEQCDGGALIEGDCCTSECTLLSAGTVCREIADDCDLLEACDGASGACPADLMKPDGDVDGVCDEQDICPVDPDPAQEDGDGDGLGDACDPCTNGVTVGKPKVRLTRYTTGPGDDTFTFTGQLEFTTAPLLDPVTLGSRIIVEDASGTPIFDVAVPPGAYDPSTRAGWKANKALTTFTYRTRESVDGVVDQVRLSRPTNRPTLVKFRVVGRKGGYAQLPVELPLGATIVLDAPTAATGECGETGFLLPPAKPACAFNGNGSTLNCK